MKHMLLIALLLLAIPAQASDLVVQDTNHAYCNDGSTSIVKYVDINEENGGDHTVIPAVSGKALKVLNFFLHPSGSILVRWESGAGGTALTGRQRVNTSTYYFDNCVPYGCFQTAVGDLLNLETNGLATVRGHLTYVECASSATTPSGGSGGGGFEQGGKGQ